MDLLSIFNTMELKINFEPNNWTYSQSIRIELTINYKSNDRNLQSVLQSLRTYY